MTDPAEEPSSLLDWATRLASDPTLRTRLADEPRAVLDEQGLADLPPADLHHSLPLLSDSVAVRLGTEVDAAAMGSTAARHPGERLVVALARHLVRAAAVAALVADPTPEPAPDQDHASSVPDHVTPLETPTMTNPASAAAAHGVSESAWSRIEIRAEKFGYGDDVDRFISVANQSDDPFTALYGDGLGDRYWYSHRPSTVEPTPAAHPEHDLGGPHTGLDEPAPAPGDPFSPTSGGGEGAGEASSSAEPRPGSHTPTPEEFATDMDAQAHNRQVFLDQKATFNHFPTADAFLADASASDDAFFSLYSDYDARNDYSSEGYAEHQHSPEAPVANGLHSNDGAETSTDLGAAAPTDIDGDGAGGVGSAGFGVDTDLDGFGEPDRGDAVADVRTPGTPQGQWQLELEARSHGYPSAEAYASDTALTGGLRDNGLAWEPGNAGAAYGQLQNYMDAAAAGGVPVSDYAATHHFTQDQIDAAYDNPTDPATTGAAGADSYVPHGDDPFGDMLQASGQGTGLPTTPGGDLDDFGSGPAHAGDASFGAPPSGGESFGAGDVDPAGGTSDPGPATDAGPHGDHGDLGGAGASDHSDGSGFGDDSGSGHTDFPDHADSSLHSSGSDDGGTHDGGSHDGGSHDGGSHDAGGDDGGSHDGGGESFG